MKLQTIEKDELSLFCLFFPLQAEQDCCRILAKSKFKCINLVFAFFLVSLQEQMSKWKSKPGSYFSLDNETLSFGEPPVCERQEGQGEEGGAILWMGEVQNDR